MPDSAPAARGVYEPRRPQASPLFRFMSDHLHRLQTVYDERFTRAYGPWRPVVARVAEKFLACGVLEHGFARIRCDACAHEYLLASTVRHRSRRTVASRRAPRPARTHRSLRFACDRPYSGKVRTNTSGAPVSFEVYATH